MKKRKIGPAQWFAELNAAYRLTKGFDLENRFIPSPHSSDGGANAQRYWTPGHTLALLKVSAKFEFAVPASARTVMSLAEVDTFHDQYPAT